MKQGIKEKDIRRNPYFETSQEEKRKEKETELQNTQLHSDRRPTGGEVRTLLGSTETRTIILRLFKNVQLVFTSSSAADQTSESDFQGPVRCKVGISELS